MEAQKMPPTLKTLRKWQFLLITTMTAFGLVFVSLIWDVTTSSMTSGGTHSPWVQIKLCALPVLFFGAWYFGKRTGADMKYLREIGVCPQIPTGEALEDIKRKVNKLRLILGIVWAVVMVIIYFAFTAYHERERSKMLLREIGELHQRLEQQQKTSQYPSKR